jgi:hypothetical protein
MMIKANGLSALMLATGLLLCLAGPSQAAASADATANSKVGKPLALNKDLRSSARHKKSSAHQKPRSVASKSSDETKSLNDKISAPDVAGDENNLPSISSSVANANAQLPTETSAADATAMTARANELRQAAAGDSTRRDDETLVVAADQLNDVDRALHEGNPPTPSPVAAPATSPVTLLMASSGESSSWDQTSLIGKVFIGFGALLTMASAARMFMA